MTLLQLGALLAFSASLAFGQILFKLAAADIGAAGIGSGWLFAALLLYGASTVLWLWILTAIPLVRAYPFALLGAGIVPPLAWLLLGEAVGPGYLLGLALIIAGLAIVQLT
jgi:drug/metabolite transporter (DMT)-like permease